MIERTVWTLLKNLGFLGRYLSDHSMLVFSSGISTENVASSSSIPSLARFTKSPSESSYNMEKMY